MYEIDQNKQYMYFADTFTQSQLDILRRCFTGSGMRYHIITHVTPDGDTIGSALGIGSVLALMSKDRDLHNSVTLYGADRDTHRFGYMFDAAADAEVEVNTDKFVHSLPDKFTENDVIICVDTAVRARLGVDNPMVDFKPATTIVFDHHQASEEFGDICIIDSNASSCCELLLKFLLWCKFGICSLDQWLMHKVPLCALYSGMCTDTLGFATDSVSSDTYELLAHIRPYVSPELIGYHLWSNTPEDVARYKGYVLMNMKRFNNVFGKFNITYFISTPETDAEFTKLTGICVSPTMKALVVSTLRQIAGTDVAISVSENNKGESKVSVRVLGGCVKANELMSRIGGGGHEAAAGAVVSMSANIVFDLVYSHLRSMIR